MGAVAAPGGELAAPAVSAATAARARPYAPSWLDRLYDAIDRLPGSPVFAYAVLVLPAILTTSLAPWLSGLAPVGQFDPNGIAWGVMSVAMIAAPHRLRSVAGTAFDAFRPALGTGVEDPEQARYEVTTMPARWVIGLTIFSFVITPAYYIADPVASGVVGYTPIGLVPRYISEALASVALLAILYQAIRQMRIIGRLHDVADRVDPFHPAPLYAFSRLTAEVGLYLILFNSIGLVLQPEGLGSAAGLALYLPWLVGFTVVAVAVFVVPMRGMHRRLETVKAQFEGTAEDRMRDLIEELNGAIDARETARVVALDRTISALRHERELLTKLPTWPWSVGTIRGFGSALLLPLAVFLIQLYLERILGG